ncbi:protein-lysine N-methyltransferase EEF2KMT [Helicoverpa armigera]|uniref:protein-lysine N-methyltransferase EEF2KMT n=1 Tax=Helicoverpa armigera TaxID=29058 RepID=UPI0030838257
MSAKTGINDLLLNQLIEHFYNGNLNFCLQKDDIDTMNWDFQQAFLDATVNSELLKQYPISGKFASLYLKKIIQNLEPNQEVHDDFYSQLCTTMNNLNQDGFSYRHYLIGNDTNNIVTIKETRNMVVNGTTGLKTWEAALMLSDWALCNPEIFANKNIQELGCGVGFTGITISKLCNVKSLTFTDCHNDVLKTVCENIQINFPHYKQETAHDITMFKDQEKSLSVMMLDWNTIDNLPDNVIPDIVIGADIVYDPSILIPLCNVIKTFCTRNKRLEVYIASVIRNEETFALFLKTLDKMDLEFEKIQLNKSVLIKWDESIDKCLLKINAKLE